MSITRERLLEIIVTGPEASGAEQNELARMALAAMDSEPWCLPLDYLQGHKDGLEWASQLAEANHPETGDWLYDDPIELAKAIRKGPDMPPSQPTLDTEPVAYTDERNLGYIDRGRETAYLWGKQNSETGDVPLYRHAQPASVVPAVSDDIGEIRVGRLPTMNQDDYPGLGDWWVQLRIGEDSDEVLARVYGATPQEANNRAESLACRAAMLQELQKSAGASNNCRSNEKVQAVQAVQVQPLTGINPVSALGSLPKTGEVLTTNSPVIPEGYVMVPKEPTEAMINAWLSEVANWRGHVAGYKAMLAAAPQPQNAQQNIPEIIPGWIPVSERMPEDEQEVLTINKMGHRFVSFFDKHSGLFFDRLDAPAACCIEHVLVTHWMPLPAAPREAINVLIPLVSRNEREVK
ncbi:DUF551 domain-containing protein [Klebsiella pneumoniae]|uniref:DUF551 domain-containing protein n=1 Tax=Klebsiella pneumoniae TaxID=573 RepID=UPI000D95A9DF|nr:DUF551 domain-containing protein [Klebsiella pneumoniae]SQC49740.1 Eaa1 [Klebsiella pneumoniae]HBY9732266.1 DUF551 domain-containing protein [Klebsiella pneumoniae]